MPQSALRVLGASRQPIRKAIRRLRWFIESFREQLRDTAAETGIEFGLDEQKLAASFLDWLRAFEAQKPSSPDDRRAYVGFAAGLMLRMLVKHKPLAVVQGPARADPGNPAHFWPEGYAYVAYCLRVRAAVLEQDFREETRTVPELGDVRTWWSFRENVREDPGLAIAFLDLFAGDEPVWSMPDLFRVNQFKRIATAPADPD